jgi:enoyl-CoA hydratase/carnithine racemase
MSLGFVPEGASSYTFPREMGKQHANAPLLASEKMTTQEMYVSSLVTKVIPARTPDELLAKVCERAKKIRSYPAESLWMAEAQDNRPVPLTEQCEAGLREGHDLKVRLNSDEAKVRVKALADKSGKSKFVNFRHKEVVLHSFQIACYNVQN